MAISARITPHTSASGEPAGVSFDFDLPQFLHPYIIVAGSVKAEVGERGTFWVDPETLDLTRIDVHVVDPPLATLMLAIGTTVEYGRTQIGGSEVVLAKSAVLNVANWDGTESQNQIHFANCRAYTSESTIQFGDPAPAVKK